MPFDDRPPHSQGRPDQETPDELLGRLYDLGDELAEQMPREAPDWQRVADRAIALGELARRFAVA